MKNFPIFWIYNCEPRSMFGWIYDSYGCSGIWWSRRKKLNFTTASNLGIEDQAEPDYCVVVHGNPDDDLLSDYVNRPEHYSHAPAMASCSAPRNV